MTAALVWQKDSNFDAWCTERIVMRRPSAHRVVGIRRRAVNQLQTKICAHPPRCQQSMDCHPPRDVRRVPLPFACADEFRCRTKNAALCITRRVQEIGSRGVRVMDGKMRGALIPPTKKANALSRVTASQPCTPPGREFAIGIAARRTAPCARHRRAQASTRINHYIVIDRLDE